MCGKIDAVGGKVGEIVLQEDRNGKALIRGHGELCPVLGLSSLFACLARKVHLSLHERKTQPRLSPRDDLAVYLEVEPADAPLGDVGSLVTEGKVLHRVGDE